MKLQDSELRVMDVLWSRGDTTAKEISEILNAEVGWNKNTTYTLIKRCIDKGAIERREPHFLCHALVAESVAKSSVMDEMIDKLYGGSVDRVFAALLSSRKLSAEEIERLKRMVEELEG